MHCFEKHWKYVVLSPLLHKGERQPGNEQIFKGAPGDMYALRTNRRTPDSHENDYTYCLFIAHLGPIHVASFHQEGLI